MDKNEYRLALLKHYRDALVQPVSDEVNRLAMLDFCGHYEKREPWRVGPFHIVPEMTFRKTEEWRDPYEIGWRSGFLFNPSLIEKDGDLYVFYRAAPRKETLCSRIGLAVYRDGRGWEDCAENPVILPTEEDELLSVEDPKVYRVGDRFVMFYNGIFAPSEGEKRQYGAHPAMNIGVDMKCAVSSDLIRWKKMGRVVPRELTGLWVKAAVIPRNEHGDAVKLGGEYLMFLSEGCHGKQIVGHSPDLLRWTFEERTYLDTSSIGRLYEVACVAAPDGSDELCMDFFCDKNGHYAAGQARFLRSEPFRQLQIEEGGSLSWGGVLKRNGKWITMQGWDAKNGDNELYFYETDE